MIPQDFIQTLLDRTDIVEVIDRQVPLKKAGANYQACCPFHNEKTPSFSVSPTKQFYHCFGCGAHGTAITFLMQYGGMGFVDAVTDLAGRVGLQVPEDERGPRPESDLNARLSTLLEAAGQHYRNALRRHPPAIDYLKQRGVTGATAARFELGYSEAEWQGLARSLPDYASAETEQAGLVISGEQGKRYDRFRDRIMFPIRNDRGRLIGFGGRLLGDGKPKYLNSPETPLFHKGRELYGLFENRRSIQQSGSVVVVEGYMDVVMLTQAGAENAVATLGTAVTADQVHTLLRRVDQILFAFDGDNAGRKAAWRALENCLPALQDGKQIGFVFLPDGEDPDSFVRKRGLAAWTELQKRPQALSEFLFGSLSRDLDLSTPEGQVRLTTLANPYLDQIRSAPLLARSLRQRLSELAGVAAPPPFHAPAPRYAQKAPRPPSKPLLRGPEFVLLQGLLHDPQRASRIPPSFQSRQPAGQAVLALLEHLHTQPPALNSRDLIEQFREGDHKEIVRAAVEEILRWDSQYDADAEFSGALASLDAQASRLDVSRLSGKRPSEMSAEERAALQSALLTPKKRPS
ncbi:MAG: DNA primase [Betaproteobacteria bacterium]|nr:DNA primase [Betaproteobacteria bacterium]